jgi:hypothetical protein
MQSVAEGARTFRVTEVLGRRHLTLHYKDTLAFHS